MPPDGDVIKVGWFRTYDEIPSGARTILSVDTAMKGGQQNDWSVVMVWKVVEQRYYVETVLRHRWEFPDLLRHVKMIHELFDPETILIEDKGSGIGLLQELRADPAGIPAVAYDPGQQDKKSRMETQATRIEGGQVFLPKQAPWLEEFLSEVRRFPNGRHDDQIDAMSQFLDYVGRKKTTGDLLMLDHNGNFVPYEAAKRVSFDSSRLFR